MPNIAPEKKYRTPLPYDPFALDADLFPSPQGKEGYDLILKTKRFLQLRSPYPPRGLMRVLPAQNRPNMVNPTSIATQIANQIHEINSVEIIYVKARPWGYECWIIMNHSTKEERFRLYDLEWLLMEKMTDIGFKFHHIEREDRPIDEIESLDMYDEVISLQRI